ncbi:hypothetical protein AFEL58S_01805 [Afipia felis]
MKTPPVDAQMSPQCGDHFDTGFPWNTIMILSSELRKGSPARLEYQGWNIIKVGGKRRRGLASGLGIAGPSG